MADTDKLRPEVAEAVERMCTPMGTKYVYTERRDAACMATIRAELLRPADENAQLRDVLADRDMDREMAAHANRELAAIKARILPGAAKVEIADTDDRDGNPYGWVGGTLLSHNLIGKRVRLVVENDNG